MTARTRVASHGVLSFNLEYDRLLHGWQKTRGSKLGGGDIPATTTRRLSRSMALPTFRSRSLEDGRSASAKYQVTRHWSVEPYYVHWNVSASPANDETVTFTVKHVTARERIGFYEPLNTTDEFVVKWGFHF